MIDDDKMMEDATAAMDIADADHRPGSSTDVAPSLNAVSTGTTTSNEPSQSPPVKDDDDDDDDDATADMMDNIDEDDAEEEEEDDDDDTDNKKEPADDEAPASDEAYVCKAVGLKEEGNKQFQDGDYNQAARSYRRGVTALKKVKHQWDDQVKQLKISLYTNWSMVSYKDQKYRVSLDMSTKAVEIDPKNVKALYRRAMAHRKLGSLELARTDLRNAIAVEPKNTTCRKELISIKKELEDSVAKQKKSFAKAFDSSKNNGGSFLYDDKEELAKQREIEQQQRIKEEELATAKRKKQWEDECVSLMAKNETVLSFEEWDKQRQEKEDEEKKQKENLRKAERKAKKEKIKSSSSKSDMDDDGDDEDIQFTEAELAAMRGYKKTSDGRTTSYFTRELSHEEKLQIGDIAPKRLDTTTASITNATAIPGLQQLSDVSSSSPTTTGNSNSISSATTTSASVWNQAGTWEEKNTTEWCQTQLKHRLLETMTGNAILAVKITKVDDLNGDASVVVVSGKKRYIFDFNVKCKYQICDNRQIGNNSSTNEETDGGSNKVIASGTLRLPDICSTIQHDEVEVICESFQKSPPAHFRDDVNAMRQLLVENVRMQIGLFVQDFNQMY